MPTRTGAGGDEEVDAEESATAALGEGVVTTDADAGGAARTDGTGASGEADAGALSAVRAPAVVVGVRRASVNARAPPPRTPRTAITARERDDDDGRSARASIDWATAVFGPVAWPADHAVALPAPGADSADGSVDDGDE